MSDKIYCGRCRKEIKERIFLIEKGYGNVHAKCAIEEVIQKSPIIEEEKKRKKYLEKWR